MSNQIPLHTPATFLLEVSRLIKVDSDKVLEAPEGLTDIGLARCKVAIDFAKREDLVFKALIEDWSYERIIRELY